MTSLATSPAAVSSALEWVKALGPYASGTIAAVVASLLGNWLVGRKIESVKAANGAALVRLQADLAAQAAGRLETERQAAAGQLEKFKSDLSEDVQRRMEPMKADISTLAKLRTTAQEKRAVIAADVLHATLDYLNAIRLTTLQHSTKWDPDPVPGESPEQGRRRMVEARWKMVRRYQRRFERRRLLAEVYLDEEPEVLLETVHRLTWHIEVDQEMHVQTFRIPGFEQFWDEGFGKVELTRFGRRLCYAACLVTECSNSNSTGLL